MRIAFISDVHLWNYRFEGGPVIAGLNERCRVALGVFDRALTIALDEHCSSLVVCGDLFDGVRPEPQLLAEVARVLKEKEEAGLGVYLLPGNHEMVSDAPKDHALGCLTYAGADILDTPGCLMLPDRYAGTSATNRVELWSAPYRTGIVEEWLPQVLRGLADKASRRRRGARILVLHAGVRVEETPAWLARAPSSIALATLQELMLEHAIDAVYCGHWHTFGKWSFEAEEEEKKITGHVVQMGCLVPSGWRDSGIDAGQMAIHDTLSEVRTFVLPGPRFVTSVEDARAAMLAGCKPYVRLTCFPENSEETKGEIVKLASQGIYGEMQFDGASAEAAMRTAAGVAREAATTEDAVAAYVDQMDLEDPSVRSLVLERVKHFLRGVKHG